MRPRPMLLKLFAHALGNQVHGQAGRVGGYDGSWLAKLGYAGQQFPLDFQIFGDDFDDPIGLRTTRQIILEVSASNLFRKCGREKSCRLGLLGGLQSGSHDLVALRAWRIRGQTRRNNVQQNARQPGVREMCGDPRAHGSRSQHYCLFNATIHGMPFTGFRSPISSMGQVTKPACAGQTMSRFGLMELN